MINEDGTTSAETAPTMDEIGTTRGEDTPATIGSVPTENDEFTTCNRKRPRLMEFKDQLNENIGHALHLRLRDQRWEVKDSALEFVTRVLKSHTDVGVRIVENNAIRCVWEALDDDNESYVRSSAWEAMGYIVDNSALWDTLRTTLKLTEKDVIAKISYTLENDSEAFPRRSCIDCILLWIRNRNAIAGTLLSDVNEYKLKLGYSDMATLYTHIIKSAFEDFDWEVKLRAVCVVESIINHFIGKQSGLPQSSSMPHKNKKESDVKLVAEILHKVQAAIHLLRACDDCDHPVSEKAFSVLVLLKNFMFCSSSSNDSKDESDGSPSHDVVNPIASTEQLMQALQDIDDLTVESFIDIIHRLDVKSLEMSCMAADCNIRSNSVSFLEDILSCSRDDIENLLDCY